MEEKTILQNINKDLIQNYKFTFAKYNFTVWEKRVIYNMLRSIEVQGQLRNNIKEALLNNITHQPIKEINVQKFNMPLSEIANDFGDYKYIKKALKDLSRKFVEYGDLNDDQSTWFEASLIAFPRAEKGIAKFLMDQKVWEFLTDISKGYRQYDFQIVMSLKSVYAMRFYEMFAHQDRNENGGIFYYRIDQLKEIFQIPEDKYTLNSNFIKRVIKLAKEELDKVANYSFEFTPRKSKGSRAFDYVEFHVVHIPENEKNLEKKENKIKNITAKNIRIDSELYTKLQTEFYFTTEDIHSNLYTFYICEFEFKRKYGRFAGIGFLLQKMEEISNRGLKKGVENLNGYIINALKKEQGIMKDEVRKERAEAIYILKQKEEGAAENNKL